MRGLFCRNSEMFENIYLYVEVKLNMFKIGWTTFFFYKNTFYNIFEAEN